MPLVQPGETRRRRADAVQDLLLRCLLPAVAAVVCGAAGVAVCWAVLPVAAAGGGAAERAAAQRRGPAARALDVLEGAADLAVLR
ncbi:hypothetical protein [Actinomadura roseirufa]|uniref:hypothetical protein n=1 Tax=Actinomadura roseirufa TaxID=2094049 RepID=UPI001040E6C7|nr:hypothetical protein [Actinomadura roseirufa]